MAIKTILQLLTTLLLLSYLTLASLQIKGGIIFETKQNTILNQDYVYFTRTLDTSSLTPLKDMLKQTMEVYDNVCKKAITVTSHKQSTSFPDKNKLDIVTFTDDIPYIVKDYSTMFVLSIPNVKDSEIACNRYNATLPEIRTSEDYKVIKTLCKNNGIIDILSNIRYDSQFSRFYYESDYTTVQNVPFSMFSYKLPQSAKLYSSWNIDPSNLNLKPFVSDMAMFYTGCADNLEPLLQPMYAGSQKIICEARHTYKKEYQLDDYQIALYRWIAHNCKRDSMPLQAHIEHTIREIEQITSPIIASKNNNIMQTFLPQLMQSQSQMSKFSQLSDTDISQSDEPIREVNETNYPFFNVSAIQLSENIISALNIRSKNITLKDVNKYIDLIHINPTSRERRWITEVFMETIKVGRKVDLKVNPRIEIPTAEDIANIMSDSKPPLITVKQFQDLTYQISSLNLNQQELSKFYNKVNEELKSINKTRTDDFDVMTTLMAEIDTKQAIRFAINIFRQITMKIANILIAASQGTTSPFVLNQVEFKELRAQMQTNDFKQKELTNNFDSIKTTLLTNDQTKGLTLQLQIPIIDTDRQYQFFKLTPIPIFTDNTMHLPDIGTTNIAINKDFTLYTTLTEYDFWKCMDSPTYCRSNLPMRQYSAGHNCVMKSFMSDEIACPLIKSNEQPFPFLFFYKLELIYSVESPLKIFIRCNKDMTENKVLEGIGRLSLQPGCTIQTTGSHNSIYYTPTELNSTVLKDWNTFQIAQFTFANINTTIEKLQAQVSTETLNTKEVNIPSMKQILKDAFHPSKSLATAVHVLTWIIVIIIIASIIFCCFKTELYRFCFTDIANCRNLKRRTIHKIEKRKKQHRDEREFKKHIKMIKKQITQNLDPKPTTMDSKTITQSLQSNYLTDQRLNSSFDYTNQTSYSSMIKEPTYVTIPEINHRKQQYPEVPSLHQLKIARDMSFESKLLQTPTNTLLTQKPNAPTIEQLISPHIKKKKSKSNSAAPTIAPIN